MIECYVNMQTRAGVDGGYVCTSSLLALISWNGPTVSLNMQKQAVSARSAADKMRYGGFQQGTYMDNRVAKTRLLYCSVRSTENIVNIRKKETTVQKSLL